MASAHVDGDSVYSTIDECTFGKLMAEAAAGGISAILPFSATE